MPTSANPNLFSTNLDQAMLITGIGAQFSASENRSNDSTELFVPCSRISYSTAEDLTASPTSSCSYIKLIEGNGRYLDLPVHEFTNSSLPLGSMKRITANPSVSLDDQASMGVNFDLEDLIGRVGKKAVKSRRN
jgi:hypothetical protein